MAAPVMSERERETAADKRLYLEIGLTPVTCSTCGAEVAVKKNSRRHTSVQWSRAALETCSELSGQCGLRLGCPRLKETIDQAVADGTVVVPGE